MSASLYCLTSKPLSSVFPILVTTVSVDPAGKSTVVNDSPDLVSKSCALSQSLNVDQGPTKIWNSQFLGLAATLIGVAVWYASSAGFT